MSFQQAIDFIKFHEGGEADHPADRGVHTIYGISSRSFPKARYPEFWNDPSWRKAEQLYRRHFWDPHDLDELPDHYGVIVLGLVVQHPPTDAQRIFQRGLNWNGANLVVDGDIGPKTLAAARTFQRAATRILAERITYYGKIVLNDPTQKANWAGWMWRNQCLQLYAFGAQYGLPIGPDGRIIGE